MIAHDDEAEHHPIRPIHDPFEVRDQSSAIVTVVDNILTGVAARHDVVNGILIFDAESSGHERSIGCQGGEGEQETKNHV